MDNDAFVFPHSEDCLEILLTELANGLSCWIFLWFLPITHPLLSPPNETKLQLVRWKLIWSLNSLEYSALIGKCQVLSCGHSICLWLQVPTQLASYKSLIFLLLEEAAVVLTAELKLCPCTLMHIVVQSNNQSHLSRNGVFTLFSEEIGINSRFYVDVSQKWQPPPL